MQRSEFFFKKDEQRLPRLLEDPWLNRFDNFLCRWDSPLEYWRSHTGKPSHLFRLASILFQMLIQAVQTWDPAKAGFNQHDIGCNTAGRRAILWHRQEFTSAYHAELLHNQDRLLWV